MRYRITVRGDKAELRGYITTPTKEGLAAASQAVAPIGLMVASPAEDDYNPFNVEDGPEMSIEAIRMMMLGNDIDNLPDLIRHMAHVHFLQAQVIQGERARAEAAEAELRDRELHHFETEQIIEQVKAVRSNYPEKCEVHEDDPITCGWKSMVAGIDKVLAREEHWTTPKSEAGRIAAALEDNWEHGDLAGAVNGAITYLRGLAASGG